VKILYRQGGRRTTITGVSGSKWLIWSVLEILFRGKRTKPTLQVDCDQNMLCGIQLRRHDRGCQESADSDEVGKRGRKVGRDQVGMGKNGAPLCDDN
jgi:hypothetical protein